MDMTFALALLKSENRLLPIDEFTFDAGTGQRVTEYPYVYPPGDMKPWTGKADWIPPKFGKYQIEVHEWRNGTRFNYNDYQDATGNASINLYTDYAASLGTKAGSPLRHNVANITLALGEVITAMDGAPYFGLTHKAGEIWYPNGTAALPTHVTGGGNLLTYTVPSGDGVPHSFIMLIKGDSEMKPVIFLTRERGEIFTDMGSFDAIKGGEIETFAKARVGAGMSWWMNAVKLKFIGTPAMSDLMSAINAVREQASRIINYRPSPEDAPNFIHPGFMPEKDTTLFLCSPGLTMMFALLENEQFVGTGALNSTQMTGINTNNTYRGKFRSQQNNYLEINPLLLSQMLDNLGNAQ